MGANEAKQSDGSLNDPPFSGNLSSEAPVPLTKDSEKKAINPLYGPKNKRNTNPVPLIGKTKPESVAPKQENSTVATYQPATPYAYGPINFNPTKWFKRRFAIIVVLNVLTVFFCQIDQPGTAMWFVFGALMFAGASAMVTIQSFQTRALRQRWPELMALASIVMVVFSIVQLGSSRDRVEAKQPVVKTAQSDS